MTKVRIRKKLIEVALPLEAINEEGSLRKRKAPGGYPTTLHKWWAQRPLAAARAVIFAQMVDDPSSFPDLFPTEKAQEKERARLFRLIEDLVRWENTSNESVLGRARDDIWTSWRRACADNADHPNATELFNRNKLPPFHDPFAGSGAIPLEAQRLGLEAFASDLNPVAVMINKAMIEIPPKLAGKPPVNPKAQAELARGGRWNNKGAQGLADDVRYYGQKIREQAAKSIGHLYPSIQITAEMLRQRPDLKPYVGQKLTVVAWLWARTVKSPNPAFAKVDVPLASTFMLATKAGREVYIEPVIEGGSYRFTVRIGKPDNAERVKVGTKAAGRGANFVCLMSGSPISGDYIKAEGKAGRMGARLMAIVAEGARGRIYLGPTTEHEEVASTAEPTWRPEGDIAARMTGGNCTPYGLTSWGDLFTDRQLVALTTLSDLVGEAGKQIRADAIAVGFPNDDKPLRDGGCGALAYAEAVEVYVALAVDRAVDYNSTIATWRPKDSAMRSSLAKQAIPMTWDFAEGSLFGDSSAGFEGCLEVVASVMDVAFATGARGEAKQADAAGSNGDLRAVRSTDPPYYDNIGYADLSDFFYVWMRRSLRNVFPDIFATVAVPKAEELVATVYRHGGKEEAERFFLDGMTRAMHRLAERSHPAFPVTIYYAFKQTEGESDAGVASTGWETFLDAVIRAGFGISGTWPVRTEGDNRQIGIGANALASSIVLVCRPREPTAAPATRREFVAALKNELPIALRHLQAGNIAPVDLAQAAIGPGMAIYTRYANVLDAKGDPVSVHEALALINATLDEVLAEQEGDFDADSRWALAWFEQHGFAEGEYGVAETLSTAKNTSVSGLASSGILESKRGKVRLLKSQELPADWDPENDEQLPAWEAVNQLIRVLGSGGEPAAAALVIKLGARAETARELAYRLYTICERKKRATEAIAYNSLVQSWPEIARLAQEGGTRTAAQTGLFDASES